MGAGGGHARREFLCLAGIFGALRREGPVLTPETVLNTGQHALEIAIVLILVLLVPALAVGLLVSMFQAATQINEMTLSFIPKLIVTLAVVLLAGPWMLSLLTDYTRRLIENIPYLIG